MKNKHEKLHSYIAEHQENICGIVAMKNGRTVYSDFWHNFKPTDTTHVMSVTKSVVSLLIGIALDLGLISDVRQNVLEFFPDYIVKRGEKTIQSVTIEHLLTMTAPYKYRSEPWTKICTSDDWTKATLDVLGGRAGISGEFRYSTLGIQILTGILAKVSGMNTVEFANKYLFEPIGAALLHNYTAITVEEHKEFILSKHPKENIWFADPQGIGTAGYGLCLSAPDMVKLGQLCLDGGICNGKQVVSSEWITESTKPRCQCDEMFQNMGYGYLWWTPEIGKRTYAALGDGGNVIYIDPEHSTVVAVNATFKPRIFDRVQFIQKYIEPLLDSCV
jgi:CubicO group peptidase (beta-lactamase class C family)